MRSENNGDNKATEKRPAENDENEPDWGDDHEDFDKIYENTGNYCLCFCR
jgi:hypothetical protein